MPVDLVGKDWFDEKFEEANVAKEDGRYPDAESEYNTLIEKAQELQTQIRMENIDPLEKARLYQPHLELFKRMVSKARGELEIVRKEKERAEHFRKIVKAVSLAGLLKDIGANNKNIYDMLMRERTIDTSECSFNVLRRWNSYTPLLCSGIVNTSGGGYYIAWKGLGVVVDPGIGFLRNVLSMGYSIQDTDIIILTHSHVDHTADFEGINTLLYEINEKKKQNEIGDVHKVRLMASVGAANKFFNMLSISYGNFLDLTVLRPHQEYKLSESLILKTTPCQHNDLFCKYPKTCVGLKFEELGVGAFAAITSDTGYWVGLSENFNDLQDKMMVLHIGSIKRDEVSTRTRVTKPIYEHHLGLRGVFNLIFEIKPSLVLISEFGEEFLRIRQKITEILDKNFSGTRVLPADIGLTIDFSEGPNSPKIICTCCKTPISPLDISLKTDGKAIQYVCPKCKVNNPE